MRVALNTTFALLLVCMVVTLAPQPHPVSVQEDFSESSGNEPLAVCFAEGTDPEYMAEWTERLLGRTDVLDYNLGGRWTNTAHGATGTQGDGVTLTYSFVPDGVNIEGSENVLFETMNSLFGSPDNWQPIFAQVFDRWSEVTGNTYVLSPDDGASWGQNSPGVIGVRGDIRIASTEIDGGSGVLAYNFFPNRGDMVLDAEEDWNNPSLNFRFLRNVVAHEHGHGLGIEHVCPINSTKLMEPNYTPAFDGPQHDDILAGQRGYGDPYEPNDTHNTGYDLGLVSGTRIVDLASLDDNTDLDWWRLNVVSGRSLTIRVEPAGRIYLEGEQNGDGSCESGTTYNTNDDQNLNISLYAGPDTTFLISAPDHGIGNGDELFRYDVPSNVTNLKLLVSGATNNSIQPYRLSIESVDPATPYLLGCPLRIDTTLQSIPADGALILSNPAAGGVLNISSIDVSGPFTVTPQAPVSLQPNSDQTFMVSFDAQELGTQTGTVTFHHNGPGAALSCEITATAITSGIVFFTGQVANIGDVPINTMDSVLVGLRAEGNVALSINSMTTSAPFSVNFSGPVSIQPGPLLRVYPRVVPTQLGEVRGWLVIQHSAPSSPDSIELIANGTPNLAAFDPALLPTEFALHQNYPNPFNPSTLITFDLPQAANVSLLVFNIEGRLEQQVLENAALQPGRHSVEFNASGLPSGVYFYRLQSGEHRFDRKMFLLK
ncbi:matrixin family metalloprotease [bacterium]|nr:matrixin family metalloprotease [bacterium]